MTRVHIILLLFQLVLVTLTLQDGGGQKSQVMYKCDSVEVPEEFLDLLPVLQYPYLPRRLSPIRLGNFATQFNKSVESIFNFTLVTKGKDGGLDCTDGDFLLTISKSSGLASNGAAFNFTPDGWLGYYNMNEFKVGDKLREEIYIHPENYCVKSLTDELITIRTCKSRCYLDKEEQGGHPCVPKCCELGSVISASVLHKCEIAMESPWIPSIYSNLDSSTEKNVYPNFQYYEVDTYWSCLNHGRQDVHQSLRSDEFRILLNGSIYFKGEGENWLESYPRPDFCMEGLWDESAHSVYSPSHSNAQEAWYCGSYFNETSQEEYDKAHAKQYESIKYLKIVFSITLVSCLIYTIIMVIFIILWSKQNVHGYTLFIFTVNQFFINFCRMVLYGIVVFDDFVIVTLVHGHLYPLCIVLGVSIHFFLISSFSWTSIISFDVWNKIRSMKPGGSGKKKLILYSAFGFGLPAVIVIVGAILEFSVSPEGEAYVTKPGYEKTCVIAEFVPYVYYVSIAITTLFITNMAMALHTLVVIWQAKRDVTKSKESATSSDFQNRASLIGKLFILMGVFLIFEITIALANPVNYSFYFVILEFFRIFHALGCFHMLLWNNKVRQQLAEKYPIFRKESENLKSISATTYKDQKVNDGTLVTTASK